MLFCGAIFSVSDFLFCDIQSLVSTRIKEIASQYLALVLQFMHVSLFYTAFGSLV